MNQLQECQIVSQRSPQREKCGKCGRVIPAWNQYHRAAVDLDGPDPRGIDLCAECYPPKSQQPQPSKPVAA